MDRNTENLLELEAKISANELEILECRANLEESPRSEALQELLEMLLDKRLSMEERLKNLTYKSGEPSRWSETTQSESFETDERGRKRIVATDSRYQAQ
jgi:hypothetical protein